MKVDVQGVVGPVTVKAETKSLPNKCSVTLQSESVDVRDSLALVLVKSKVNEEKLSGFLSSMDISSADVGMGGWPETAPRCHEYTFMECSRVRGTFDIKSFVSFIYAPLENDRGTFWDFMRNSKPSDDSCWVCVGDLNELAGQIEKLGGHANSSKTFMNVQNFLFDCDLVDMGFKGSKFTCSNRQLDYLKAKKKGGGCEVAMMVDMSKAYDKLEWDFIGQGGKLLRCVPEGVLDKGIKLARGCPTLSHCFFVEDSIFFFHVEKESCEMMKWILDAYCKASGQLANLDKSCLFFTPNTPDDLRLEIVDILGVENAAHPGKYLGLPVVWEKSKDESLAFVHDKLIKKIQGWKHSLLSQAAREVLIKAVANAIPAFPMSFFKFPKKTCASLDRAIAKFRFGQ
ncbi:reverse transcriptase [Senna tora]|uniref:Reverse transcriptase n=1 Tax=Senna tora TaxID=362788 RepID=A0A834X048_9FABA|nr:reverse transcriptase [Senna tora]